MQQYLAHDYDGPAFELFGTGHIVSLAIMLAILAFLIGGWRDHDATTRRRARLVLAGILLLGEVSWHGWNLAYGTWNIHEHLPLHVCSISSWGTLYVLLTRSYRVYEIIFFIGIAGSSQTLLTPEAGIYGLPHFRAIQTLMAHGVIVVAMVYMTTIEGFRPTWSSVWKTMLLCNLYLLCVTGINVLIGSNYMYTLRKPTTSSLLDLMGPWPWYLLTGEIVALLLFVLLYLPFAVSDRKFQNRSVTGA